MRATRRAVLIDQDLPVIGFESKAGSRDRHGGSVKRQAWMRHGLVPFNGHPVKEHFRFMAGGSEVPGAALMRQLRLFLDRPCLEGLPPWLRPELVLLQVSSALYRLPL